MSSGKFLARFVLLLKDRQSAIRFSNRASRWGLVVILAGLFCLLGENAAWAQDGDAPGLSVSQIDVRELFRAGGVVGVIILALSVAMLALIVEHMFSIRRNALMPRGLAEDIHQLMAAGQFKQAEERCLQRPSFLSHVLSSGLADIGLGYSAIEKSMEDASTEQAARLFRKIEYLSIIGTIAPMLGLLGTVWGMILAFMEFESKANPQVAELAPGIYRALVTTLMGLIVAVPAMATFAIFRNRIDELVAESSLLAEHVFADLKRSLAAQRKAARRNQDSLKSGPAPSNAAPSQSVPSVTMERKKNA